MKKRKYVFLMASVLTKIKKLRWTLQFDVAEEWECSASFKWNAKTFDINECVVFIVYAIKYDRVCSEN